jgi:hypothetical protein
VEVAEDGREIWLRGKGADEAVAARLLALPASGRYEWVAPDRLRRWDERIPARRLPDLQWQPLLAWVRVALPAAALPGDAAEAVALRLVRSGVERDPDVLLTGLEAFQGFAAQAAQVRLERLRFAATAEGRVLVAGTPLPPLPGLRFVVHAGVAVPAGFAWEPAVAAAVLARRFGAGPETLVLWNQDGTVSRLHREQLMPATRSAVRATWHAFQERA